MENQGASAVITHHILDDKIYEYEKWLEEIMPLTRHAKGFIDLQIVRPIPQLTYVYTVIIRFDKVDHLKMWLESTQRKRWIEKVEPLFRRHDLYQIRVWIFFLKPQRIVQKSLLAGNNILSLGLLFIHYQFVYPCYSCHYCAL